MWIISVGNAFDGITLYGDKNGNSFESHEEAIEKAEELFGKSGEEWNVILVVPISDLEPIPKSG